MARRETASARTVTVARRETARATCVCRRGEREAGADP